MCIHTYNIKKFTHSEYPPFTYFLPLCFQAIENERGAAKTPLEDCRKTASQLVGFCGTPGRMEIQKHMEDLENVVEEIDDGIKERDEELSNALEKAEQYDATLQVSVTRRTFRFD